MDLLGGVGEPPDSDTKAFANQSPDSPGDAAADLLRVDRVHRVTQPETSSHENPHCIFVQESRPQGRATAARLRVGGDRFADGADDHDRARVADAFLGESALIGVG